MNSTESDMESYDGISPAWFIGIELLYVALFAVASVAIRKLDYMKTDDDAVTSHHRYHALRIKKQEEDLIAAQRKQENFIRASQEAPK